MLSGILVLSIIQAVTAQISWDTACGVSKGCFPDCPGGCEYLVTWQQSGLTIEFTLMAAETDTNVYLAIGFSEDYRMGDDSVVGCIVPSSSVISAYNDGLDTDTLSPSELGLTSAIYTVNQINGVVTCNFTRDITNNNDKFFDLNNDYILMLVIGEGEGTSLGKHYMIPWSSERKVDFNSNQIVGLYKLNSPLVKLHGIMMVAAWMLFSVVGLLTARYNKDMFPRNTMCGSKVWFQVHRISMVAVVIFFVVGLVPIFIEMEGYSQIVPSKSGNISSVHPVIGIVLTVFTFANPLAALLRPANDHKYRRIFNFGHMLLGIVTQVLAVFAIIVGYYMERSMLSDSPVYVTVGAIVVVCLACIILDIHKWIYNKKRGASVKNAPYGKGDRSTPNNMEMEEKSDGQKPPVLPLYTLIVVGLILYGLTVGIIGIIGAS